MASVLQKGGSAAPAPAAPRGAASAVKLGVFTLAMMNVAAVVSLRGIPAEAEYGLSSIFYYLFAAVFFLIPVSLVAAELATGWPQNGGVFRWVGEAFGPRWGFLAIWLQWLESTIWYPTVLTFAAVALAFLGPDQTWDQALAANKWYTLVIVLLVYWGATFINFRGVGFMGAVSKWGSLVGTIIPATLLIVLGFVYFGQVMSGTPDVAGMPGTGLQIKLGWDQVIPDFTNFNNIVLAASIFLFYAGMEMSAVHVKDLDNPARNYPLAILVASILTVAIFVLGTLAVGFVVPNQDINLVQTLLVFFDDTLDAYHVGFLKYVMALCLAFGVLGGVVTWVGGPSKGLLAVGRAGYLPPFLQQTNANGIQVHILLVQALIVTFLSVLFVVLPSVQTAYQILSQLTIILYLIMYLLMFGAAIHLRYSEPNTYRAYKVPGGEVGMWIIGGAGLVGSLIAFLLSFVPPSQIPTGGPATYVGFLIAGTVVCVAIPFLIYASRKPHWRTPEGAADFEPFNWEREGRHPGQQSTR
ncbi:MAG: amino acid permease [Geminicoccaceae bacterium]